MKHTEKPTVFHELLRFYRLRKRMGIREYCEVSGIDFSNYSKYERGVLKPPTKESALRMITKAMDLSNDEFEELRELAYLAKEQIPPRVLERLGRGEKMTTFFRAMGDEKITKEKLLELLAFLDDERSKAE